MLHRLSCALLLAALPLPTLAAAEQEVPVPSQDELEALLKKHDVPGLSYAELRGCDVHATRVAGFASLTPPTPVAENTLFEAASLSKPLFAWLVMDLARDGVVDLDRPFADFGFDWPRISDKESYAKLTPRLVLTHRTGLPNWAGNSLDPERTDALAFTYAPDTEHSYSGEGIQILQRFVEHQTGKSLGTLFRERLGTVMPRSSFNRSYRPDTQLSRGYAKASEPGAGDRDMMPVKQVELAAASLATTARDFAHFMSHICKRRGLPADSYAEMLRPQTPVRMTEQGLPIRWALGWSVLDLGGRYFVMHTGNNGEYRAFAGFYPDNGEGFVMLTNGSQGTAMINDFLGMAEPDQGSDTQEAD